MEEYRYSSPTPAQQQKLFIHSVNAIPMLYHNARSWISSGFFASKGLIVYKVYGSDYNPHQE